MPSPMEAKGQAQLIRRYVATRVIPPQLQLRRLTSSPCFEHVATRRSRNNAHGVQLRVKHFYDRVMDTLRFECMNIQLGQ